MLLTLFQLNLANNSPVVITPGFKRYLQSPTVTDISKDSEVITKQFSKSQTYLKITI